MNPTRPILVGALLLGSLWAQEPAATPVDAKARLQQLQKEQQTAISEWQKAAQAAAKAAEQAEKDGKPIPAMPMRPDMGALRAKYLAAAKDFAGDDQAKFLVEAFRMGDEPKQYQEVLDLLMASHMQSKEFAKLGQMFGYLDQMCEPAYAEKALARIQAECKEPKVLAWVTYANHSKTLETAEPKSAEFQEAEKLLLAAAESSGDSMMQRMLKSTIAEKESFGIGSDAPDIEGQDLDDVAFKLSDYRGKVVFLDFWGDW